jgi:hypothetical protein
MGKRGDISGNLANLVGDVAGIAHLRNGHDPAIAGPKA